jgi:hypothetical protein
LIGLLGLRMPPMPTRQILVRVALAVMLMAALVVLADGVVHQELRRAASDTALLPVVEVVQTTGALR